MAVDGFVKLARPALRYHGGKWVMAPWLIGLFPPHRAYVEPFCGAASVLLRKPRANAEVLNDLDHEIVNLFTVLRDTRLAEELRRAVTFTPFARAEFELAASRDVPDPVERARRMVARSFMGFGSNALSVHKTGFRSKRHTVRGNNPARDWANWPESVPALHARLQGVVIENRDALELIRAQDAADTLFYVDPPYPHSTRSAIRWPCEARARGYKFEMTDDDHRALAAQLREVKGMVVVSGYECALYDEILEGWERRDRVAFADGARQRKEVVWMNAAAAAASGGHQAALDDPS